MKYAPLLLALAGALGACSGEKAPTDVHAKAPSTPPSTATPSTTRADPLTDPNAARAPVTTPNTDPRAIDTRPTDPVGTDAVVTTEPPEPKKPVEPQEPVDPEVDDALTPPGEPVPPQTPPNGANTPGDVVAKVPASTTGASGKNANEDAAKPRLGTMDLEFVSKAAVAGLFEVESSELAVMQATTPFVREFAQMMVMDHESANRDLEEIARGKGATFPKELDSEHQKRLTTLRDQKGVDFDRQYRDMQVTAHKDAIALYDRAATECEDADLKAYAAKVLPTLRAHQKKLNEMPPTQGS